MNLQGIYLQWTLKIGKWNIAYTKPYLKHTLRFQFEISKAYLKLTQICSINSSFQDRTENIACVLPKF